MPDMHSGDIMGHETMGEVVEAPAGMLAKQHGKVAEPGSAKN